MACENCCDEQRGLVKQHNRTLRTVNRKLRTAVRELKEAKDEMFLAICRPDETESERALRELWESGGFDKPIGPEDYPFLVELCLTALCEYNERHTSRDAPSTTGQLHLVPEIFVPYVGLNVGGLPASHHASELFDPS